MLHDANSAIRNDRGSTSATLVKYVRKAVPDSMTGSLPRMTASARDIRKKYVYSLNPDLPPLFETQKAAACKIPVISNEIDMYAKPKNKIRILYGLTPSVPRIPSQTTDIGMQVDASRMMTHKGGAVARFKLMGEWGIRTGKSMKKMEMTKKTRVTTDLAL